MKAISIFPGKPNSVQVAELAKPSVDQVPNVCEVASVYNQQSSRRGGCLVRPAERKLRGLLRDVYPWVIAWTLLDSVTLQL